MHGCTPLWTHILTEGFAFICAPISMILKPPCPVARSKLHKTHSNVCNKGHMRTTVYVYIVYISVAIAVVSFSSKEHFQVLQLHCRQTEQFDIHFYVRAKFRLHTHSHLIVGRFMAHNHTWTPPKLHIDRKVYMLASSRKFF